MQINLVNNLLTEQDERAIDMKLRGLNSGKKPKPYEHMLERYDMCYHESISRVKN